MDEYSEQLRTELEGMERLKDIYLEEAHEYNVLYDDAVLEKEMLRTELAAVKLERDELRLKAFQEIKFMFDLHSDGSSFCNGYRSLCDKIKELTNKT
jgi:hypothetical protein